MAECACVKLTINFWDSDIYGDHQIGCGGNGDRIHRHDSIRDALFSAAQTAALAPRKEAPALIPGSSSRPADVYLPVWSRGKPDVTVIYRCNNLLCLVHLLPQAMLYQ